MKKERFETYIGLGIMFILLPLCLVAIYLEASYSANKTADSVPSDLNFTVNEGYEAAKAGVSSSANPYLDEEHRRWWLRGWQNAQTDPDNEWREWYSKYTKRKQ